MGLGSDLGTYGTNGGRGALWIKFMNPSNAGPRITPISMKPSTAGNLSNLISLGIVMIRMVPMEVMARGEKLASMGDVICDSRSFV